MDLIERSQCRRSRCIVAGGLVAGLLLLARCDTTDPIVDPPAVDPPARVEIIAPARVVAHEALPVVVRMMTAEGALNTMATEAFDLAAPDGMSAAIQVKKGVGSLSVPAPAAGDLTLSINGVEGTRQVEVAESLPSQSYAGMLPASVQVLDASVDRVITGDLIVPEGGTLIIEAGTRVLLGDQVNLEVRGTLTVNGTEDEPILFTALDPEAPWGGIDIIEGTASLIYSILTQGGADASRAYGHSDSQPVLKVDNGQATVQHSYFIDNPGKALGVRQGELTFEHGLISRCDTGGEFHSSRVHIAHSHILDIPNDDGRFVDDDNDGLYFGGVHASGEPSIVEHTYIITGKDDAIDHNGARLEVRNSWLEDFAHEGVAGSNANWVRVYNTVVRGCEQGIEAGYYTPNVYVDHSVIVDNEVGLRFGDSYDWGSEGRMTVTNTILFGNEDDVRNFDLKQQAPVDSGIVISYSLVEDPEYGACPNCITGTPAFDERYYLLEDSPGRNAASDGRDIGRVRENTGGTP